MRVKKVKKEVLVLDKGWANRFNHAIELQVVTAAEKNGSWSVQLAKPYLGLWSAAGNLAQLEAYWKHSYKRWHSVSYLGAKGFFDHQPTLNYEMAGVSCRHEFLRDLNRLQLLLKKKKGQKPEEVEQLLEKTLKRIYWSALDSVKLLSFRKSLVSYRKEQQQLSLGKEGKVTPSDFGKFLGALYNTEKYNNLGMNCRGPSHYLVEKGLYAPQRSEEGQARYDWEEFKPYVHYGIYDPDFPHFYRKHYQRYKENGALSRRWQWWDHGDEWRKAGEWLRVGGVEIKGNGRFAVRTYSLKKPPSVSHI